MVVLHHKTAKVAQKLSGSLRKQGLSPIVQQNQEFSIQNEDFPALPGFKGAYFCSYGSFYASYTLVSLCFVI
jgi:hypothetical protein